MMKVKVKGQGQERMGSSCAALRRSPRRGDPTKPEGRKSTNTAIPNSSFLVPNSYALLASSLLLLTFSAASAAEYSLSGTRFLRLYTAPEATPVYNAEADVQRIAGALCDVPWTRSDVANATSTGHAETNLDANVTHRENFDAALFCAKHVNGTHVAYANAAAYRFEFPAGVALPNLTSLGCTVYSDPYNVRGARIAVYASDDPEPPTACATVRGDAAGGVKATNVAARITRRSGGKDYWYPATTNLVLTAGGMPLRRYLFVFVVMENYATSRGNWIEGCSWIDNAIRITTSADVPGWSPPCDVPEPFATQYHLKDGHAGEDADGDGLSNYAEYLISKVFGFASLNPDSATSDGVCPDFFRRYGSLYLGEMFARMPGQRFGEEEEAPRRYKAVRLRVTYDGPRRVKARVVAQAWSRDRDAGMCGEAEAEYATAAYAVNGTKCVDAELTGETGLDMGGACCLCVFADEDGDGAFTPGEPFGFVREAWLGADETAVYLSDASPVFARFDLVSGAYADMPGVAVVREGGSEAGRQGGSEGGSEAGRQGGLTRVRVVRVLVDGRDNMGVDYNGYTVAVKGVMLDKYLDLSKRRVLHEGDFVTDGELDVGWGTTVTDVYGKQVYENTTVGIPTFVDATNITYAVVLGEGAVGGSNAVFRCTVDRHYDPVGARYESSGSNASATARPVADPLMPQDYVYGARPTFRWRMQDGRGKDYGGTYTAFRLQVRSGNTVVFDSGYRAAPPPDRQGRYVWRTDVPFGAAVAPRGNYTWRVGMFNAKYANETFWNDQSEFYAYLNGGKNLLTATWSDVRTLVAELNAQQPMGDHGHSTVAAAVKYAGPERVIEDARCILRAYGSAALAGAAAGQCYVTNAVAFGGDAGTNLAANARVCGLKAGGTYWLEAFVDTNGNGVRDDFETRGTAGPVTLAAGAVAAPQVTVFMEDADTDGDWVPDAYEMELAQNLTTIEGAALSGGRIYFPGTSVATAGAGASAGLDGASLTTFRNVFATTYLPVTNVDMSVIRLMD